MNEQGIVRKKLESVGEHHPHKLIATFTVAWVVWLGFFVAVEFGIMNPTFDPWIGLLIGFVGIEGLAILTKPTGDTLSAHAWAFLHNAPARLALSVP